MWRSATIKSLVACVHSKTNANVQPTIHRL